MKTVHHGPAGVAFNEDRARVAEQALLSETMPGIFELGVPSRWTIPSDAARVTVTLSDGRRFSGAITHQRAGVVVFEADS